jgi:hypothetical protein
MLVSYVEFLDWGNVYRMRKLSTIVGIKATWDAVYSMQFIGL